ncbi:SymE family type I addiction module toxin [Flavobacterium tyrosinilyticum]|nr:SymE family type I addiction module toxin [Flavobacterium tyrosinilyticum]MCM0664898.1 type I toxin-antitoxin system SymE family toxin [Flavobacterium tyrosinilyticum]
MTNAEKTSSKEVEITASIIKKTSKVLSIRRMKAYAFYRLSRSIGVYKTEPVIVPQIRLCGNWLKEAGFLIDEPVAVTVMKGELIIRPVQKE